VLACGKPLVLDADALNLLAQAPQALGDAILTPHPGEAAPARQRYRVDPA
jgi:NAD(P)H-hydrate epimerase